LGVKPVKALACILEIEALWRISSSFSLFRVTSQFSQEDLVLATIDILLRQKAP
jgi:hypothetical protein